MRHGAPPVQPLTAAQITAIRWSENANQGMFAPYLNVAPSTVSQWEDGEKCPSGTAIRALQPGDPCLFELHAPCNVIAGGGSFVEARQLLVSQARMAFERRTGVRDQGILLTRVTDAYGRRCAVTGERTLPIRVDDQPARIDHTTTIVAEEQVVDPARRGAGEEAFRDHAAGVTVDPQPLGHHSDEVPTAGPTLHHAVRRRGLVGDGGACQCDQCGHDGAKQ